ncbi:MAG TPA: methyl-accepting chemotaxis protein [Symbiobacteriaceae bacterium]|nr:methyl-accepting chemotaxis protein [Symbiobacteriaceae bacterium]
MKKQLHSLRTTLSVAFGLMLLISILTVAWTSISATREAYLSLAIRDLEYLTTRLMSDLDTAASKSTTEAEFAQMAGPVMRGLSEDFFVKNGMTGYAAAFTNDGAFVFHPKQEKGNMNDSVWGKAYLAEGQKVQFTGTIFYDWQNPGEKAPRAKLAVLRRLPSKPDWHIAITAYTEDDLLLPFRSVQNRLIVIGAGVLLAAVVLTLLLATSFTRFLARLQSIISRLAEGDLRTDHGDLVAMVQRKDELGDMAVMLRSTIGSLRAIVHGVTEGTQTILVASTSMTTAATSVSSAAEGAAAGAAQVARGASEQARHADEVGRTMSEFQQTISQIAAGAADSAGEVQQASQLLARVVTDMDAMANMAGTLAGAAADSARSAERGAGVVGGTISGMDRIRQTVGGAAQELTGLSALSAQITEITEAISGIADQTSMLSLNAAIEAARAGEHGRGFAVVAEEVRRLADRSAASARNISDLVARIQGQTARAVQAMESGTAEVDQGSRLVAQTGEALSEIIELARRSAQEMQSITALTDQVRNRTQGVVEAFSAVAAVTEENTAATEELSAGTEQVTSAVQRIAGIVQENAAATEEVSSSTDSLTTSANDVARSARELEQIAQELQQQVSRFRL